MLVFEIVCHLMLYIVILSHCLNAGFPAWVCLLCHWVNFRFKAPFRVLFQLLCLACFLLFKQIKDFTWFDLAHRFKYTSQQFERFICQIRQLAECNILDSTTFFPLLASLPLPRVSLASSLYDTIRYVYIRSKVDVSRLNLYRMEPKIKAKEIRKRS